jgi:hypothetical protein
MDLPTHPPTSPPLPAPDAEVVSFLRGRSASCPRCAYDLRDIQSANCPECGELLVLKIGSARPRFGWLILAMAPGCFSGVAALFVMVPIALTIGRSFPPGQGLPWPIVGADLFGFLSAGSVVMMYLHRQRIMAWRSKRQGIFAGVVWLVHMLAFAMFVLAMAFLV